jgi:hypothetical protein
MLAVMTRALGMVIVATVLGTASAGPRAGKVVRVERRARAGAIVPRWCDVSADEDAGICRGPRPSTGDTITVVGTTGILAEIRIAEVDDTTCNLLWKIRGRVVRGDFSSASAWAAVVDAGIDGRSRLMPAERMPSPSGRHTDEVQFAIDRDGDGREDIVGTSYVCDDNGQADPNGGGDCYDVYTRSGPELGKAHPTLLPACTIAP